MKHQRMVVSFNVMLSESMSKRDGSGDTRFLDVLITPIHGATQWDPLERFYGVEVPVEIDAKGIEGRLADAVRKWMQSEQRGGVRGD